MLYKFLKLNLNFNNYASSISHANLKLKSHKKSKLKMLKKMLEADI